MLNRILLIKVLPKLRFEALISIAIRLVEERVADTLHQTREIQLEVAFYLLLNIIRHKIQTQILPFGPLIT